MRVLIVSTVGMDRNGISTVIMNYFRLCQTEINFDVVVNNYIIEDFRYEFENVNSKVFLLRRKFVLTYLHKLNKLVKENKYDIIHVHGNSSTMALELYIAKRNNIPIRIAHCHNSECNHKLINKMLNPLLNKTKTNALACSKLAGEWLFGNDFSVLPNGIDICNFSFDDEKRKKIRQELKLGDSFVVGHVGLFNEQKNHKKLFGVFYEYKKLNPTAKLLCVCGNLDIPHELYDLAKEFEISDSLIVLNNRRDIPDILMAMDFFVFPSKWEGLGLACIEAETTGLNCLVSEEVPVDVDVTENIAHLSLMRSNQEWAQYIFAQGKNGSRKKASQKVADSIYNISRNKETLMYIYNLNNRNSIC